MRHLYLLTAVAQFHLAGFGVFSNAFALDEAAYCVLMGPSAVDDGDDDDGEGDGEGDGDGEGQEEQQQASLEVMERLESLKRVA